jgi:hypothetical protein
MLDKLSMRSIDEKDTSYLDASDAKLHAVAKNFSYSIHLVTYLCFSWMPIIFRPFFGESFMELWDKVLINAILKPARLFWYHGIYQPGRLISLLLKKIS